ncbi:uncharacterized protein METZ01_LOCUS503681 [marine metagenome]|uniref:Uncharacterized protein n=1 Tax=marine metagenome TaxID=408172 RepID=A0A383E1U8_9ZZZZ
MPYLFLFDQFSLQMPFLPSHFS